jgi:hypothetical protein
MCARVGGVVAPDPPPPRYRAGPVPWRPKRPPASAAPRSAAPSAGDNRRVPPIYVTGYRQPGTGSTASAIGYSELKGSPTDLERQ